MLSTTIVLGRLSAVHLTRRGCIPRSRTIHGSCVNQRHRDPPNPVSHGAENYFVDGDETPPPNASIYRVDATSDTAQSAYDPPSGPWSRADVGTTEYRTISKDEPYDVGNGPSEKLRYGGKKRHIDDKGPETGKTGEGSSDTERWGRKPEGRA